MQDFLTGLTPAQLKAVQTVEGPLLILAGAGTGKTRTLVCRLAYLAGRAGIDPARLLAITFTTKAAEEMRSRLAALDLPGVALTGIRVCTIHSLCLDILREYGSCIGIGPDFCLIEPAARAVLIKQAAAEVLQDCGRQVKKHELHITREKNAESGYAGLSPLGQAYQRLLEERGMLDFDDLILKALDLFRAAPDARAVLRSRFSHISIDEYQDVNAAQYAFFRALCPQQPNLCAVGDPDQAIYGFRGAQAGIFLRFQADYPDAALVRLEDNYRSSAAILASAQAVIACNSCRIEKSLRPSRPNGAPLELWEFAADQDEAAFVASEVERLMGGMRFESLGQQDDDCVKSFGDIAVLYRLHQQGRLLKKALQARGIPVDMAATRSVFEEPAIQNMLSLLELIAGPAPDTAAAELLTDSAFAVSASVLERLRAAAGGASLFAVLAEPPAGITPAPRQRLQALSACVNLFQSRAGELGLDRLIAEMWGHVFGPAQEKSDDYFAFLTASMAFSGIPAGQAIPLFLEKTALLQEGEICTPRREAVTLMTVHSAKGLEFPVVFITGLEQGLFPLQADADSPQQTDPEEERRLFYVAMTRARDRLYVVTAAAGFFSASAGPWPRPAFWPSCLPSTAAARSAKRRKSRNKNS